MPRAGKERIMELVTTAPLTNLHLLPRFVCQLRNFCKVNLNIWETRWDNGFKGLFKADKTLSGCVIVAHYVRRWIIQPDNSVTTCRIAGGNGGQSDTGKCKTFLQWSNKSWNQWTGAFYIYICKPGISKRRWAGPFAILRVFMYCLKSSGNLICLNSDIWRWIWWEDL